MISPRVLFIASLSCLLPQMSQKVTTLEQEIERLTDGAELENVSPLETHISNYHSHFF